MDYIARDKHGDYGVYTWIDGFKKSSKPTLGEESKTNPEAVINRYMNKGDFETGFLYTG